VAVETKQVRAGRDTILGYVERASPVDILAELIWNALDAEAMNVETTVAVGGLDGPEEIVVRDDGHRMPHDHVSDFFLTHGEPWKRTGRFSPNINRPLQATSVVAASSPTASRNASSGGLYRPRATPSARR
jgi:Histidine kinase-, DNA gyrase B-, and HSP90-like ATPase